MTTKMRTTQFIIVNLIATGALFLAATAKANEPIATTAGLTSNNSGSPVGPPKQIVICYKGKTRTVPEPAVPSFLERGATLGPCPGEVVICHKNDKTLTVNDNSLPAHLAHGDTLGPCPNRVFMCNNLGHTIVVKGERVSYHLSQGHTLGLCSGKQLICYKGKTRKVADSDVAGFLAKGAFLGYCLGEQGPIVSSNSLPSQVSP